MTEPEVSVVIPCYDRLALLERTLRACFTQELPGAAWEIVVADNHPDRLAAPLGGRELESPVPLRHVEAGERNIALARNRGVAAADGALIAFVDDDEAPEPGWLLAHLECLRRTGRGCELRPEISCVRGRRGPCLGPGGRLLHHRFPPAARHSTSARWTGGRRRRAGWAPGNSMLRRATCLAGRDTVRRGVRP